MASWRRFLCGVCIGMLAAGSARAGTDIGIVVLHGTQGMPA
nr:hypothetical protein [uncultured Rhodopila sp.]